MRKKREPLYLSTHLDFVKRDFVCVVADTIREGVALATERTGVTFDGLTEADWQAGGLCITRSNGATLLVFQYAKLCASLICHEVTHVTNGMFDCIGLKWSWEADEAFAYHNDLIFRLIGKLLTDNKVRVPLLPSK